VVTASPTVYVATFEGGMRRKIFSELGGL